MHRDASTSSLVRVFGTRFVIAAGLTAALTCCTRVASELTGPSPTRVSPTTCSSYCTDLYTVLILQEEKLREENLGACRLLPQPERGFCLEEEGTRHAAEMARLEQWKADCLSNCAKEWIPPG